MGSEMKASYALLVTDRHLGGETGGLVTWGKH